MIIKQKQKIEKKNLKIKSCCPKIWSFLEEKQEMQACKRLENRKREQWRMVMCCHEFIFLLYIFPSLTKRKTSLSEISLPLVIFKICLEKIMGSLLLATAWMGGLGKMTPRVSSHPQPFCQPMKMLFPIIIFYSSWNNVLHLSGYFFNLVLKGVIGTGLTVSRVYDCANN